MNIQDFAGDKALEENGTWVPFDDARFLIGSHMNQRHRKALARLAKKNQKAMRTNDEAAIEELTIEAMAEGLVLGWEGVKNGTEAFPHTKENAIALLKIRTFRDFVANESQNLRNFQVALEESAKAELKSGTAVVSEVE